MLENDNKQYTHFERLRGKPGDVYSDDFGVYELLGKRQSYSSKNLTDSKVLERDLENGLNNPTTLINRSRALYAANSIYADIINYYAYMSYFRYKVTPVKLTKLADETVDKQTYAEQYRKMLEVVDGIQIAVTFPELVKEILITGSLNLYADKDNKTGSVVTFILPPQYCREGFKTQFGTSSVAFDFKYFSDIKSKITSGESTLNSITFETYLELFPKEFAAKFKAYESDTKLRWQQLDARFSTCIRANEYGVPPKILTNNGIVDYNTICNNDLVRSTNELEKILVHKVPNYEGELLFDIPEAKDLHRSMKQALLGVNRLKVLTTFGDTELLELQGSQAKENKAKEEAYKGIYFAAGVNPNIFHTGTDTGLGISTQKDAAYVDSFISKFVLFYNLAINNLYNFKPFQAKIAILPITVYNSKDRLIEYRESASLGVGKIDLVIASGVKQSEIQDMATLEEYLELDKILIPLQSSYTQSGKQEEQSKGTDDKADKGTKPKKATKEPKPAENDES